MSLEKRYVRNDALRLIKRHLFGFKVLLYYVFKLPDRIDFFNSRRLRLIKNIQ